MNSSSPEIEVVIDKFTVQYMLKDKINEKPFMLPLKSYKTSLTMKVPGSIAPFIPAFIRGFQGLDPEAVEARIIPEYNAPKNVVDRWRRFISERYPDVLDEKTSADAIIDLAVSFSVKDKLDAVMDKLWDTKLCEMLKATPEVPEGYGLAGRYLHIINWHIKNLEEPKDA